MGNVEIFYLTEIKLNPKTGKTEENNKYYKMTKNPDGKTFTTEWGRVGCTRPQRKTDNPISDWDKTIKKRISHHYRQQTELQKDLFVEVPVDEEEDASDMAYAPIQDSDVAAIVQYLTGLSTSNVRQNYQTKTIGSVTKAMVEEAQKAIDRLAEISYDYSLQDQEDDETAAEAVRIFNEQLKELFMILPRKMKVANNIAYATKEFSEIIDREQVLLNNMRCHVVEKNSSTSGKKTAKTAKPKKKTILEQNGIEMRGVTSAEEKMVKQILGRNASLYKNAWSVTNVSTETRFNDFVKKNRVTDIRHLIHGTADKNVWPISVFGLIIRPANQATHGSNLGRGNYFANDSDKGLQYAHGGRTFLLIMKVAYGKPHDEYDRSYGLMNLDHDSFKRRYPGCDVMHAHSGRGFWYDEIVAYENERSTIEFIVEIKRRSW